MDPQELTIQVLIENTANRKGLLGEHGLSYLIKIGDRSLLFDTGQGLALSYNASVLDVDLHQVDSIILSHGHYDHTGGLRFFLNFKSIPTLYAHPSALQKKFARKQQNRYSPVGIPTELDPLLSSMKEKIIWTEEPTKILENIWVTGPIPRTYEWEQSSGSFYLDEQGQKSDEMNDDQSIYIRTKQGVVVLLGCAHAGVINTLQYIKKLTHGMEISFVIGGMHLIHASLERIHWTIRKLHRMNIHTICPCHCTGAAAIQALRHSFEDRCVECSVGEKFTFEVV